MDVYEMVTDEIVRALEAGTIPWKRPWDASGYAPTSLATGKTYNGVNALLLSLKPYASPFWLTFKQAQDRGGMVRKGERSTRVVFFKPFKVQDAKSGEEKTIPLLRYFSVFNVCQCDGIDVPELEEREAFDPIDRAEDVLSAWGTEVPMSFGGGRAFYSPSEDRIGLPLRETFSSAAAFYATGFHESVHSTGHASRLDRPMGGTFGTAAYAREELVAELGACMLATSCGIDLSETVPNAAAYIESWLRALKDDRRLIVTAASRAQRAADLILSAHQEEEPKPVQPEPIKVVASIRFKPKRVPAEPVLQPEPVVRPVPSFRNVRVPEPIKFPSRADNPAWQQAEWKRVMGRTDVGDHVPVGFTVETDRGASFTFTGDKLTAAQRKVVKGMVA